MQGYDIMPALDPYTLTSAIRSATVILMLKRLLERMS